MSKNVKIKLNREGVRALLRGEEMQDLTASLASGIVNRTGGAGYECDTYVGNNRCNTSIYVTTYDAYHDNLKNNTLLKSLR